MENPLEKLGDIVLSFVVPEIWISGPNFSTGMKNRSTWPRHNRPDIYLYNQYDWWM